MHTYMPSICTYTMVAHLAHRRGDEQEAVAALERVECLLPRLTPAYWWQMIVTRVLIAPVLVSLGRRADAESLLDEAGVLLSQYPDSGALADWCAEARDAVTPRRRPAPSPELSTAERRVLQFLASDLTLREIGRELYLSRNTIRTHAQSICRKLGVTCRKDAVIVARRASAGDRSSG